MSKRLTPLQQLIESLQKQYDSLNKTECNIMGLGPRLFQLGSCIEEAKTYLTKEQQLLSETWDAGSENYKQYINHCENGTKFTYPDKDTYLSQFKPE